MEIDIVLDIFRKQGPSFYLKTRQRNTFLALRNAEITALTGGLCRLYYR